VSFFASPRIEIVELDRERWQGRDPRSCEPGDTIFFEDDGVAFTLLEELMKDDTHVTWRTLITAHPDEDRVGKEEWVGVNLAEPLPRDRILIRGC